MGKNNNFFLFSLFYLLLFYIYELYIFTLVANIREIEIKII